MNLNPNFTASEMACPCCSASPMDREFMRKLQALRDAVGPIIVTSGYRCPAHNSQVGGSPNSYHMRGYGADIKSRDYDIDYLAKAAKVFFKGVITYPTWVHVDDRERVYYADKRS